MSTPSLAGGRYDILRELGRGGMGEVFLARQTNLGRLVVVKRVLPEHAGRYADALIAEARVAARLHHPNIVSVLDVHEGEEPALVVMELVAGVTLREMLERARGGLPADVAIAIAVDVLRGLHYAHGVRSGTKVGVVHRDVKPRNLVVAFAGTTKLIDFGISRWLGDGGSWESTSVSGTEGYMAPEQRGAERIDGRVDQYAVGITLREMLTGVPPYDGEATSELRRAATAVLAPELAAIVDTMCARAPEARYADCAAAVDALQAYATAHDVNASPTQVERWLAAHLADRAAAWELEASDAGASATALQPAEPAAAATQATAASTPRARASERALPSPPPPRRWLRALVLGGVAIAGAAAVTLFVLASIGHPRVRGPVVLGLEVVNLGSAEDAWLAPAVDHVTRRALRDLPHRPLWLAAPELRATRSVTLAYRHTAEGVHLEARDGAAPLAAADADSVYAAADQLAPLLAAMLADGDAGPDPAEARAMARDGARTYDEYRRFRSAFEDARFPTWLDSTTLTPQLEQLVTEDPAWLHPYTELQWLYGPAPSAVAVAAARAHGDRARDPSGAAILDALEFARIGNGSASLAAVEPFYTRDTTDPLVLEPLIAALPDARGDEAAAMDRILADAYPALFYTGTQAEALAKAGRVADAEQLIRATAAAQPDNLVIGRELARIASEHGDLAAARAQYQRMLLVHGTRPLALAELYEAALFAGDTLEAERIVERMALGSPLSHARGRYRAAVIAVFEGRFAAAAPPLRDAIAAYAPFGPQDSELPQALHLASTLAALAGDPAAAAADLDAIARYETSVADPALNTGRHLREAALARAEAARLRRGATCPAAADLAAELAGAGDASTDLRRLEAAAGCVRCADVVAVGLAASEHDPESLVAFGRCARAHGDLALARQSFERATQLWLTWINHDASPYFAVLARYELAGVLAEQGDRAGARTQYERFLAAWGNADRALPEVAAAQRALAALN